MQGIFMRHKCTFDRSGEILTVLGQIKSLWPFRDLMELFKHYGKFSPKGFTKLSKLREKSDSTKLPLSSSTIPTFTAQDDLHTKLPHFTV